LCGLCHSIAPAPLPGGAGADGCVSFGADLLSEEKGEESSSAPSKTKRKIMNTTEKIIAPGCNATSPQPAKSIVKPMKFPSQPQEWKIVSLRECPTPDQLQLCDTPERAAEYWNLHIAQHPECLVVLILNTRR
jgi:hypothetical protein